MQKKIEKYETQDKRNAMQQDAYNELLIKYNTMVYNANTKSMDNSSVQDN